MDLVALQAEVMAKKIENPHLKVLLAVGGWNMASAPFTEMVATDQNIATFVNHAVGFLRAKGMLKNYFLPSEIFF